MTVPSLTVMISARNAERTLRRAMVSTLRAMPEDAEMIVRSDGSTDRTLAVARSIVDRRVLVLEDDDWLGIADSGNRLLEEVLSPLVTRMDADDVSLPGRFAAQMRRIDAGVDVTFATGLYWRDGTPLIRPQRTYPITRHSAPFHLLLSNPFMHPSMVAKTEVLRRVGGYRSVSSEDYELYLRVAAAGYDIDRDPVPRVVYRRHAAQSTAQGSWWKAQAANSIVEESFNSLALATVGFVPCWFEWRRALFSSECVPTAVSDDIELFAGTMSRLSDRERRPVDRLLREMRRHAGRAK